MDKDLTIQGDLCQMGTKRRFLNERGISTEQMDVYPIVKEADIPRALQLIWTNKVEGWWHYKDEYIEHGICTEEEFKNGFN